MHAGFPIRAPHRNHRAPCSLTAIHVRTTPPPTHDARLPRAIARRARAPLRSAHEPKHAVAPLRRPLGGAAVCAARCRPRRGCSARARRGGERRSCGVGLLQELPADSLGRVRPLPAHLARREPRRESGTVAAVGRGRHEPTAESGACCEPVVLDCGITESPTDGRLTLPSARRGLPRADPVAGRAHVDVALRARHQALSEVTAAPGHPHPLRLPCKPPRRRAARASAFHDRT
jgi:hypothetical protein